jgi:hypothetical protein
MGELRGTFAPFAVIWHRDRGTIIVAP